MKAFAKRYGKPWFWVALIAQLILLAQLFGLDLVVVLPWLESYELKVNGVFA